MKLEELLKVIPETEYLYVTCGEVEYLGCKKSFLLGNLYLDKEVKSLKVGSFKINNEVEAVFNIGVEE